MMTPDEPYLVDPFGDVILICPRTNKRCCDARINNRRKRVHHSRNMRILISSHELRRASNVLISLVDEKIAKGMVSKEDGSVEIRMPHSSGEDMLYLCSVLYKKNDLLHEKIDEPRLYNLALLVDKYKMSERFRPWAKMVITKLMKKADQRGLLSLQVSSYLLRCPRQFQNLGSKIIMKSRGRVQLRRLHANYPRFAHDTHDDALMSEVGDQLTPIFKTLQQALDSHREQVWRTINHRMDLVQDSERKLSADCKSHCTAAQQYKTAFTRILSSNGMWPSSTFASASLDEIFKVFRNRGAGHKYFVDLELEPCCGACYIRKVPSTTDFAKVLKERKEHVHEDLPKPCLKETLEEARRQLADAGEV